MLFRGQTALQLLQLHFQLLSHAIFLFQILVGALDLFQLIELQSICRQEKKIRRKKEKRKPTDMFFLKKILQSNGFLALFNELFLELRLALFQLLVDSIRLKTFLQLSDFFPLRLMLVGQPLQFRSSLDQFIFHLPGNKFELV